MTTISTGLHTLGEFTAVTTEYPEFVTVDFNVLFNSPDIEEGQVTLYIEKDQTGWSAINKVREAIEQALDILTEAGVAEFTWRDNHDK